MTLQQLKYLVAIAEAGSFGAAAKARYVSQPSLSVAVGELEKEIGFPIFARYAKGVELTPQGSEFMSYARQVLEQADLLEARFIRPTSVRRNFSISTQHYAFVVNAFSDLLHSLKDPCYTLALRETRTAEIIDDVKQRRSSLGILYLDQDNRRVMRNILRENSLTFTPLVVTRPHVFISRTHPLASATQLSMKDLASYPRLSFSQGVKNSFYFSEEVLAAQPMDKELRVTDRATLFNLLVSAQGYTLATGILAQDINREMIVAIPLESKDEIEVGYIMPRAVPLDTLSQTFITYLKRRLDIDE